MEVLVEVRNASSGSAVAGRDTVRGRILRVTADSLLLAVSREERTTLMDTLALSQERVLGLRKRVLEPGKTAGLVAGSAAVLGGLTAWLLQGRERDTGPSADLLIRGGFLLP